MQQTQVPSLGPEDPLEDEMTPVFLPGKSQGQKSLAGHDPWGRRVRHNWASARACLLLSWGFASCCSTLEPPFLQIFPWLPHFKYLLKCQSSKRLVLTAFFKKDPLTLSCLLVYFSSQLLLVSDVILYSYLLPVSFCSSEFKVFASSWKNSETSKEVKIVKWEFT